MKSNQSPPIRSILIEIQADFEMLPDSWVKDGQQSCWSAHKEDDPGSLVLVKLWRKSQWISTTLARSQIADRISQWQRIQIEQRLQAFAILSRNQRLSSLSIDGQNLVASPLSLRLEMFTQMHGLVSEWVRCVSDFHSWSDSASSLHVLVKVAEQLWTEYSTQYSLSEYCCKIESWWKDFFLFHWTFSTYRSKAEP